MTLGQLLNILALQFLIREVAIAPPYAAGLRSQRKAHEALSSALQESGDDCIFQEEKTSTYEGVTPKKPEPASGRWVLQCRLPPLGESSRNPSASVPQLGCAGFSFSECFLGGLFQRVRPCHGG